MVPEEPQQDDEVQDDTPSPPQVKVPLLSRGWVGTQEVELEGTRGCRGYQSPSTVEQDHRVTDTFVGSRG